MRKGIIIILAVILVGYSAVSYGGVEENNGGGQRQLTVSPPEISAQTAILIEANSGEVLYEKSADQKAYPASITKIMTALLAIENGNLDKKVKVSEKSAGVEGSSIYLEPGETIPLRDLIYGLMLRSGNDAAIAISEEI